VKGPTSCWAAALQLHKAKALTATAISLLRNSIEMILLPTCLLRAASLPIPT
jgi:hypothetical protein